jgi:hypothetical protein
MRRESPSTSPNERASSSSSKGNRMGNYEAAKIDDLERRIRYLEECVFGVQRLRESGTVGMGEGPVPASERGSYTKATPVSDDTRDSGTSTEGPQESGQAEGNHP